MYDVNTAEIDKLYNLCAGVGMNVTIQDWVGGKQVILYDTYGNKMDDAVCCKFSHGAEEGFLETFSLNNCDGWETAEQIFEGWRNWLEKGV